MKIVVAPDSFKESMTAKEVCEYIEKGLKAVSKNWEIIKIPMADGGEGTLDALIDSTKGKIFYEQTVGPLGDELTSRFGILGEKNIAVIEMASTSGLELISPEKRNPYITTTFGTGQLILKALDLNVEKIILGIGGSATNDGGAGMLQALGAKLLDENNNQIGYGGYELSRLKKIDFSELDERLKKVEILVACDVTNPLTGENGASHIFGKQKGATPEMIKVLDRNLLLYSKIIEKDLGIKVDDIPGSGAAGGLGAGLLALGANLKKGIDIVIEASELEKKIAGANIVITGEGSIDGQTRFGKTPYGVAMAAKKQGIPTIILAGNVGKDIDILYDYGFDAIFSIMQGVETLESALENGKLNLERTAKNIGKILNIIYKNK
ncbi:glycerate kinase [Fusobacterium sp.]|uniref:glycerate kinase n=1 Tax=Fusobacterium sp. TaxID=68766 RepID=UPI0025BED1A5|nr:glycerate kinase [Fusobacterium sp.]MCI5725597.1 glycerate kinase [Fusobacterium sp.]MCI7223374.1 glycerate kinase [Fusobacterium sp.]